MTNTYTLLNNTYNHNVVMNDESASDAVRNAAAFAFDKNMSEIERRAEAGDVVAQRYLAEAQAEFNEDFGSESDDI